MAFAWHTLARSLVAPTLREPSADPFEPDPSATSEPGSVAPNTAAPVDAEPVAAPAPEPEPEPAVTPSAGQDVEVAPRRPRGGRDGDDDDDDDDDGRRGMRRSVRRAEAGDWGMQFTFGGLAPLSIAGVRDLGVNRLLVTELGFRRVTENWIIPFSIGAGVFHHNPDDGSSQNDAGLSASFGLLKPFRVWRRISPYAGGMFHFHYLDPTGANNWLVNVSIGPVIGTEFYVGDRVSLLFQGQFDVGINAFDGLTQVHASTSLAAGGQTGLVFYF